MGVEYRIIERENNNGNITYTPQYRRKGLWTSGWRFYYKDRYTRHSFFSYNEAKEHIDYIIGKEVNRLEYHKVEVSDK